MSDDEEEIAAAVEGEEIEGNSELTESKKLIILIEYFRLLPIGADRLPRGAMQALEEKFSTSKNTIGRILKEYIQQSDDGVIYPDLKPKKTGNCGAKSTLTQEIADCLLEFNSMTFGKLTIRRFLHKFADAYDMDIPRQTLNR